MLSNDALLKKYKRAMNSAEGHSHDWREEAKLCYDFVAGDQWDEVTKASFMDKLRPIIAMNLTGKYVDAISGIQINNRQTIRFLPRELGDVGVNELLTGTVDWARDEWDAEDEETDAFSDMIITGMGWVELFMDHLRNEEGLIGTERRDPLEMFWDKDARKRNLRDATWIARKKKYSVDEFQAEFPGEEAVPEGDADIEELGSGIHDAEAADEYINNAIEPGVGGKEIVVTEFQYSVIERAHILATAEGKQTLSATALKKAKKILDEEGIEYATAPIKRRVYYRAFIKGEEVLRHEKSPYQKGFTYYCLTGKRDRNSNTWYGVVRAMIDPQIYFNKFFSQILHTIDTNAKGGLMAEEGAFKDITKAERDWSSPDKIVETESGAISGGKIKERPQLSYPQGTDRLMQFTMTLFPEVSGLNMEFMGLTNKVQPGILEHQRKQAAISVIAWAFDSMRRYYKDAGTQYGEYVRKYLSDGRLIRINGERGAKYVPLLREELTAEYDVIVEEAPTSANMKERVWAVLMEMIPHVRAMGLPLPPSLLDYTPLPEAMVEEWKGILQQPNPDQEIGRKQAEAEVDKTMAEAEDERASAEQRRQDAKVKAVEAGVKMVSGGNSNGN